jgi:hypothetical protein
MVGNLYPINLLNFCNNKIYKLLEEFQEDQDSKELLKDLIKV